MPEFGKDFKLGAARLAAALKFILSHPLNRGRLLSTLGRFAAWQIASRLRPEIEFDWIGGAKLIVARGMTGATGNIYCGLHEFVEMGFLLHLLRPDDLFLDIGANVGTYTILAAAVCRARVIAFEPDPASATALRRNIAINGVGTLAAVRETALGAFLGQIAFTVGLNTMNRVAGPEDKSAQIVPIMRLDDVPDAKRPTLIKLDVEGFEEHVIASARRVLGSPSLLAVQSELCTQTVRDILGSFGFQRQFYNPFTRTLSPDPQGFRTSNALFIRGMEVVAERVVKAPLRIVSGRAL